MKTNNRLLILFAVAQLLIVFESKSQAPASAMKIFEGLPLTEWSGKENGVSFSEQEIIERLKMLPKGERVEFVMDYSEEGGDTTYWSLSVGGIYYIDLDFDGDLDLLYSGQNGTMAQTGTKVYYNVNNILIYSAKLRDGIFDIKKNKDSYSVFTLFLPCCGSYTTKIEEYRFSAIDTAVYQESISIIGRSTLLYKGMKNYETKEYKSAQNPSIYAFPMSLRRLSAYFRERDEEVNLLIRKQQPIELINLNGIVKVGVLGEASFRDESYYLVITEPLSDLPKMPESLYEWTSGDGRRLVGWIKTKGLEN